MVAIQEKQKFYNSQNTFIDGPKEFLSFFLSLSFNFIFQ